MYFMHNKMPAPYELNHHMGNPFTAPPQVQPLARGGKAGRSKRMILAHMSPHELNILDHLQGISQRDNKTGIRSYGPLEELLKNPHIIRSVHHHARVHHANGGSAQYLQHLRAGGRNGDTELALIGDNTHNLFNQLVGHATKNPNDGHPEYFSLGGALSGLWNTVKGAGQGLVNAILPHAKSAAAAAIPMAQQALGDRFGSLGTAAGNMLAPAAQQMLGPIQEGPAGPPSPYAQALTSGLRSGYESYKSGASPFQAFGRGMQSAGSNLGGGFGSALEGAGQSMGSGRGFGDALRSGARRGYESMGGHEGLANMAGNIGQAFGEGGFSSARNAARNEASNYMRRALPANNNQAQNYNQQGYNPDVYGDDSYDQNEQNYG